MIRTALIDMALTLVVVAAFVGITAIGTGLMMLPLVIIVWAMKVDTTLDDLFTAYLWITAWSLVGLGTIVAWRAYRRYMAGIVPPSGGQE